METQKLFHILLFYQGNYSVRQRKRLPLVFCRCMLWLVWIFLFRTLIKINFHPKEEWINIELKGFIMNNRGSKKYFLCQYIYRNINILTLSEYLNMNAFPQTLKYRDTWNSSLEKSKAVERSIPASWKHPAALPLSECLKGLHLTGVQEWSYKSCKASRVRNYIFIFLL